MASTRLQSQMYQVRIRHHHAVKSQSQGKKVLSSLTETAGVPTEFDSINIIAALRWDF